MNIDFGYACISTKIKDCSTAKTTTVKHFKTIDDLDVRKWKLKKITKENLQNTLRLLWHNIAEDIKLYRFSSQLVPLATHELGQIWNYTEECSDEFAKVGRVIKKNNLKASTHPGQYTVINTPKEDVFENSKADLEYHNNVLNAMNLDFTAKMVTHVGGVYGEKNKAKERFITNFKKLSSDIQQGLVLENDDTSYSIGDVLEICQELKIPMVLDVHHHNCYNQGEKLKEYLEGIFATWTDRTPKIHFSSPRSKKHPKRHADYINPEEFKTFLDLANDYEFDVMIEAKKKDEAVLKLREDLEI
ncbi:UV DNA damage repair endonuclease UvsE [Selenihalanaerobacter shriftii]|uniref:UV-damage endonuclease n=1 Tax=Selenihalanaerobacter shriftii TaxID=142842 RepID=A0A1T4Q0R9_9FIRM|nr:UV DNA damage repair endonuclease UvsE [Selenihalanaerobacter shriftii]SJZ97324.1 UV-damage endonuclease [Selenihalanaerobacter shriftii]